MEPKRRGFLFGFFTGLLTLLAGIVPLATGVVALLNPLRRSGESADFVKVANLAALPADGRPRRFSVVADHVDQWNRYERNLGAIYLRRVSDSDILAFNVVCPHLGCFVNYRSEGEDSHFHCPCHDSSFDVDGSIKSPKSPSPRPMDTLEVEVRNENEIWVKFQNFQTGIPEKKAIS